jgi:hypothetical protein
MFASGKLMLHGFLYRPKGSGPFPAVLYDLGPSRTLAGELERLGKPHKLLIFPPYGHTHKKAMGCSVSEVEMFGELRSSPFLKVRWGSEPAYFAVCSQRMV